jgi:3-dehydroquinate synthase
MALELKFLTHEEFNLHLELFESMFLPVVYKGATLDNLIKVMLNDKKSRSGTLRFVLLEGLQNPVFVEDLDREILEKAFIRIAK